MKPFSLVFLTSILACSISSAYAVSFPGPDGFGYQGSTLPLNLRDVSATGNDAGLDNADDDVATVPIGFTFNFYGTDYTQVEISSNGFITFTPTGDSHCCSGSPIPTSGSPDNFIAPWWQDLDPGEGGIVRTQTLGTPGNREFVVGFYDVRDNDDPANVINTFEIILKEGTNDIEIQVVTIQFDDVDDKVAGIENADGTDGVEIIFVESDDPGFVNGDEVFSNEGFCFSAGGTACGTVVTESRAIPTLGTAGIALMALLMLAFGGLLIRRVT